MEERCIKKKSTQACLFITVLMLTAAALVVFGKNVLNTGLGIVLEYKYIDALFPKEGSTAFYPETVLWLRVLFVTGILAAGLIWVRKTWSTVLTLILCLSSVIIRMYGNAKHGYGLFTFDEFAGMLMMVLPFLAAGLCFWMLRLPPESAETGTADDGRIIDDGRVDLKTVLSKDEIRLLASNLKKQALEKGSSNLNDLAVSIERDGRVSPKALVLCHASTELAMMEGIMTGSGDPGQGALAKKLLDLAKQAETKQD